MHAKFLMSLTKLQFKRRLKRLIRKQWRLDIQLTSWNHAKTNRIKRD